MCSRMRYEGEADKMTDIVERLRDPYARNAWASTLCSEAADEIERLHAHIAKVEEWHEQGKKIFDNYSVGLGAMFGLGKWWAERPWKQVPFCASCGKHKEHCDGC